MAIVVVVVIEASRADNDNDNEWLLDFYSAALGGALSKAATRELDAVWGLDHPMVQKLTIHA